MIDLSDEWWWRKDEGWNTTGGISNNQIRKNPTVCRAFLLS